MTENVRMERVMMDRAMASIDTNSLPSAREFLALSRKHSLVPVYRTVTADLETPVSAFLRIAAEEPEAFLLESVEGGEHVGRYTFIGVQPYKKMVARGKRITVREGRRESSFDGDIFAELKKALGGHTPARLPGLPPFTAGGGGCFCFEVGPGDVGRAFGGWGGEGGAGAGLLFVDMRGGVVPVAGRVDLEGGGGPG